MAAYAVLCVSGCTEKEAADSVVDGTDDCGIDAIHLSLNDNELVIVQSKWSNDGSGGFSQGDALKYCNGINKLFNMDFAYSNSKILNKQNQIEKALNASDFKFKIVIVDNFKADKLPDHSLEVMNNWLSELNSSGDSETAPLVNLQHLNQAKLHKNIAKSNLSNNIDLNISLANWGHVLEPYKSYYGSVSLTEIEKWWKDHGSRLFEKNIRQILGKTDVNSDITKTLENEAENFWYYNNGITVLCDSVDKTALGGIARDIGVFSCSNISIINGAQTVGTIGRHGLNNIKNKGIDAKVFVRIIEKKLAPENFEKSVTKNNNKQNRIENRDFISQDSEQIRLQTEIQIEKYNYQIVRFENFKPDEKSFDVLEAVSALACASNKLNLTMQAKNAVGKYFENLEQGIYKELFNKGTTGWAVINSIVFSRAIDRIIQTNIANINKKSGKRYGILVHGSKIIVMVCLSKFNINDIFNSKHVNLDPIQLEKIFNEVLPLMLNFIENNYKDSFLATFFKSSTKCAELVKDINSRGLL